MIVKNYEYFLAIVEEGSISAAARKLYVSQPSLSQYLKRLEGNLGVALFDHSQQPLQLTYAGQRYLSYTRELALLDKQMAQEFSDISNFHREKIRLGVAYWRGFNVLPRILPQFYSLWPNTDLRISEECGALAIRDLNAGNLDYAIMNISSTMDLSNMICTKVFSERILLAAQAGSNAVIDLQSHSRQVDNCPYPVISAENLRGHSFIIPRPGMAFHTIISQFFNVHQLRPTILMQLENTSTALRLVANGLGVCFVPEGGTQLGYIPGNLQLFALDDTQMVWNLSTVYPKAAKMTPALQDLHQITLTTLGTIA